MTSHLLGIGLHTKQAEVFNDETRFKVVVAGRRWGKTNLALSEMLRAIKKPRQLVWYIAPTYRMARQIMWQMLKDTAPRRWITKSNETTLEVHFKNGSVIALKGADKPDTLRGVGINFLIIDEMQDVRPEVWSVIMRPTLTTTRGRAMFIGTPKAYNVLYKLWLLGQKTTNRKARQWRSWQFPTISSPFVPVSEIEAAREDMDERSFRQEFEATFMSMSGRVYWAFDRNLHVGKYAFDPKKEVWLGMDFNIDPMSAIIMQPQPNGEVWAVDEIFIRSSNTSEVCDEIERRYWRNLNLITIYPDPAGANRSHGRGESDLDILRERGFLKLRYRRKHPAVADRINAVNKMLQTATGQVRLRFDEKCKNAIQSLEETIYKRGTAAVDKTLGTEHMADAIGYPIELRFPRKPFKITGISI